MAVSKDDFRSCIDHCSRIKRQYGMLFSFTPHDFSFRRNGKEIFFLAPVQNVGNNVFSVDVAKGKQNKDGSQLWKKLSSPEARRQLTRSEQLLRERMRASGYGITNYKYIEDVDSIFVNTGSGCVMFPCSQNDTNEVITYPTLAGAMDYKLCPGDSKLLACVCDGDIWLLTTLNGGKSFQLTNTRANRPQQKKMAGQSSFILQEEFDRYTGYWWDPMAGKENNTYRIVYEEVDETGVEMVHTFNPSKQEMEDYSYPRPGGKNATSVLKCLQFTLESGEPSFETLVLAPAIAQYISQWEYITRVGWLPDGKSVWVQLLDRKQHTSQLLLISMDSFVREGDQISEVMSSPFLLWKETTSIWINIKNTCCFEFLPANEDSSFRMVVVSEETGFPHIFLLEGNLPSSTAISTPVAEPVWANLVAKQITTGSWNVMESKVWVDSNEGIVYFEGNRSSCLDKHLYAVDLSGQLPCSDPVQLTPSGFYHDIEISLDTRLFVTTYSNQNTPASVAVYSLTSKPLQAELLFLLYRAKELSWKLDPPINFTATATSGEALCGVVYPPDDFVEGRKYPTVLYVYGGPEFQIVKNDFSRFLMKLSQWTSVGFAVVMLDNRGSSNRGKAFEAHIQYNMGTVEIDDQVVGLEAAARTAPFIDLTRVAILGWSYGGYMSLLAIAKRPDVFKVAVSGAPVTDLMWYDTGYTERYLGVPPASMNAYVRSSVLTLASVFPNEPGRLLIMHGLNDENVLYTHTSLLLDALIRHGKPYEIQVFTGERHGIRNPTTASHCDATVLQFLLRNL